MGFASQRGPRSLASSATWPGMARTGRRKPPTVLADPRVFKGDFSILSFVFVNFILSHK